MPASHHPHTLLTLLAPVGGVVVPLAEVPDPVFAGGSLGPGIALDPLGDCLLAPCAGEIIQYARTAHAVTLKSDQGAEILIHLGLDTVGLNGQGIELLVTEGQRVEAGELLCRFEPDTIACHASSLITPLVVTNGDEWQLEILASGIVAEQAPLLTLSPLRHDAESPGTAADTPIRDTTVHIALQAGLHARPAARLRDIARRHQCRIILTRGNDSADASSLTALLGLGVSLGDRVALRVEGQRADDAQREAVALLETPEASDPDATTAQDVLEAQTLDSEHLLSGLVASPGLVIGRLVRYVPALPEIIHDGDDIPAEQEKLNIAVAALGAELRHAMEEARNNGQSDEAGIFEAHLAWLDDPALRDRAVEYITQGRSAGFAWREALQSDIDTLASSKSALLSERAADLRDLQRRVLLKLSDTGVMPINFPAGAIAVAEDLTPSELVALADAHPAGLCLMAGGTTSHVAILARARGLPCLVAMGEALLKVQPESNVILDAQRGVLELAPDAQRCQQVEIQVEHERQRAADELASAQAEAVTRDGVTIEVCANIASNEEAILAYAQGADGIGLLRSEFLFLDRDEAPSEAQQHEDYQATLEAMAGKPVIIRTLDVGADKALDYLPLPAVANPALGIRGVRLMAEHGELLDTQLRALLNVTPIEQLRIMVPMVSDVTELRRVRSRMIALAEALGLERLPELGVMIEVPSAALCADSLANVADFLSIGTNDLTQYTLAMDREDPQLAARADVLHPGVLRLIKLTVEGAAGRQCKVGVCGAAAGDPEAWAALVALGVDELSVEPRRVPSIKAAIRRLDRDALSARMEEWMALEDAVRVRRHLKRWLREHHVSDV
ncbi:phosphoenolpyruvate--protein phosphotransferase [Phytohalomonas tamaricis]|uniref:phosphoenolpyruvate--protein phosphotransferase n=1 Tax=Phytohalomonas tamaricis TaxID=2081032 RepID=UPI000D0B2A7F|nr:phosphoenolpyruvate--protein phosphotransferase [Phytohalomonas tamaricis]